MMYKITDIYTISFRKCYAISYFNTLLRKCCYNFCMRPRESFFVIFISQEDEPMLIEDCQPSMGSTILCKNKEIMNDGSSSASRQLPGA
ncbi:hypothetical protein PFISCL1PPCAC_21459 [Pristionchus fissidentatus]|uniref:Uncharacterized protein n=1 Tax=Pristionchus fissidentatus TaxID=1538716 RepID=A0AAV5WJV7_9BILA|nr:hypothetical protein PFISCL1PPCAC_21459 [Pristionchus fissidentatus]